MVLNAGHKGDGPVARSTARNALHLGVTMKQTENTAVLQREVINVVEATNFSGVVGTKFPLGRATCLLLLCEPQPKSPV